MVSTEFNHLDQLWYWVPLDYEDSWRAMVLFGGDDRDLKCMLQSRQADARKWSAWYLQSTTKRFGLTKGQFLKSIGGKDHWHFAIEIYFKIFYKQSLLCEESIFQVFQAYSKYTQTLDA